MAIGTELDDARFGPRVVKVNLSVQIKFTKGPCDGRYYGEWSEQLKQPHGRGIFFHGDGSIFLGNFMNGTTKSDGKHISIVKDCFKVGTG